MTHANGKRIYVAGASSELDVVRGYIKQLNVAGWNITYDWTEGILIEGTANAGLTEDKRVRYADLDLSGVEDADVFWLVTPTTGGAGCFVELGAALALKRIPIVNADKKSRPLVVVSGAYERSIFTSLADKRFATHEEALKWLVGGMS